MKNLSWIKINLHKTTESDSLPYLSLFHTLATTTSDPSRSWQKYRTWARSIPWVSFPDIFYLEVGHAEVMMTTSNGHIFRITGPLCGEFTGHRWIPLTKAIDAELWCFLWLCKIEVHCRPIRWNIVSLERYFSFQVTLLIIRWWADTNTTMGSWTGMRRTRFNTNNH